MTGAPTEEEMLRGFHSETAHIEGGKKSEPAAAKLKKDDVPKPQGTASQLRSVVDRIVRLEEEKSGLSADIKEIYEEAKSAGWTKKAVRIVVKREMEDSEQRASREAVENEAELMLSALGELASTPLGEAAIGRRKH